MSALLRWRSKLLYWLYDVMSLLFYRLLDILEVIAPYKHFHKLRQFVNLKLPPGFPVKVGMSVHYYLIHPLSSTIHPLPSSVHPILSTIHSLLSTIHPLPSTIHSLIYLFIHLLFLIYQFSRDPSLSHGHCYYHFATLWTKRVPSISIFNTTSLY